MKRLTVWSVPLAMVALVGLGFAAGRWSGSGTLLVKAPTDDHAGHDHGHEHGPDPNSLPLSDQARANLKLVVKELRLGDHWRTVTIPGVVGEMPGQSERRITTAVDGVIARVHVSPGQTVRPGDPLADIQATGEVLANAQAALLKTIQDLDLIGVELKRLEPLANEGAISGLRLIEKKYERQRLEAARLVQMQELLVRGLSTDQIAKIVQSKTLLREFTVRVPGGAVPPPKGDESTASSKNAVLPAAFLEVVDKSKVDDRAMTYSVESIDVFPGKLIQPGDEICDLALHDELRLEGMAFPRDSELIAKALEEQRAVTARFESGGSEIVVHEGLHIQFAENVVDPTTKLFRFYLPFRNQVARDNVGPGGVTFRSWRFKPGQRLQLDVPAEKWIEQFVVPTEAVVREGAEAFVFRANGKLFERATVTIAYEDPRFTVLTNDGSLFEGEEIAWNQAYQLQLALKKAQGSGVDMHAGHNH